MSWPVSVAVLVVRGYQVFLRPLLPSVCRFAPSCSEYCCQALATHGIVRGAGLAMQRIWRCHPWNPGGYDPPPIPDKAHLERPEP